MLMISSLDIFFDSYTRRLLPKTKLFWLELDFFFNKNKKFLFHKNFLDSFIYI